MYKKKVLLIYPLFFIASLYYVHRTINSKLKNFNLQAQQYDGPGLEYVYFNPEMEFMDTGDIKIEVEYQILKCELAGFGNEEINECLDLEMVVTNNMNGEKREFTMPIRNAPSCMDSRCNMAIEIPIINLLTPDEHTDYVNGTILSKNLTLTLDSGLPNEGQAAPVAYYELTFVLNPAGFRTIFVSSFIRFSGKCHSEIGNGSRVGLFVENIGEYAWFKKPGTNHYFGVSRTTGKTKRSSNGLIYSDPNCQNLVGEVYDYPLQLTGDIYVFPYECKWYEYPVGSYYGRYPLSGVGYYLKEEFGQCKYVNEFVPDLKAARESLVDEVYERYTLPIIVD